MKTVKKEFTAYAFSELSKEAQKTAISEQLNKSDLIAFISTCISISTIQASAKRRISAAATSVLEQHGFSVNSIDVAAKIDFDLDLEQHEQEAVMGRLEHDGGYSYHLNGTSLEGVEIEMLISEDAEKKA